MLRHALVKATPNVIPISSTLPTPHPSENQSHSLKSSLRDVCEKARSSAENLSLQLEGAQYELSHWLQRIATENAAASIGD